MVAVIIYKRARSVVCTPAHARHAYIQNTLWRHANVNPTTTQTIIMSHFQVIAPRGSALFVQGLPSHAFYPLSQQVTFKFEYKVRGVYQQFSTMPKKTSNSTRLWLLLVRILYVLQGWQVRTIKSGLP